MKLKEFNTLELSKNELQRIEGGILIGVAICLLALGMAIGAGIGNRNTTVVN